MTRARSWLLALAFLSLLASKPVLAVSPSYVMFYGSPLSAPVVQQLYPAPEFEFLWSPFRSGREIPKSLEGRPYVKFAIFWGRWNEVPTKPEAACQHGRLYPPTASEPGLVVLTDAIMDQPGADHPDARPIPDNLTGFTHVWKMGPQELATAKRLGVPGL